jgi:hypothetical protein
MRLIGYDLQQSDLANYRVPNQNYTFYARLSRRITRDLQPVVYEIAGNRLIGCAHEPLGLAWLPTSRWRVGPTYLIHMDPLETNWQSFGTARFYVELRIVEHPATGCGGLWRGHGRLWKLADLVIPP